MAANSDARIPPVLRVAGVNSPNVSGVPNLLANRVRFDPLKNWGEKPARRRAQFALVGRSAARPTMSSDRARSVAASRRLVEWQKSGTKWAFAALARKVAQTVH